MCIEVYSPSDKLKLEKISSPLKKTIISVLYDKSLFDFIIPENLGENTVQPLEQNHWIYHRKGEFH